VTMREIRVQWYILIKNDMCRVIWNCRLLKLPLFGRLRCGSWVHLNHALSRHPFTSRAQTESILHT
jgi:hypothetical protein